ncbi:(2Fe-2S)-binding protein [Streptomyces sp. RS10V-4]|uniref:(2Fe-2S)-binding protein n=1 Tax=Streptomyces rhizoryzae TaxID=2932493 RepID=UPI0020043544|nr:(2Fe-2S)-binding protein [Streptomyces rhizoryzae]MCK7627814.1 (2Fe-2S)-binding protein [Streptomyces rhizoryzae]
MVLDVNGEQHEVITEPRRTLVDVLRHDLRLTGTHVGCEHGICGACTVLLDGRPVRSCLMFAAQAEGAALRTVESLAPDGAPTEGPEEGPEAGAQAPPAPGDRLSDLQQAFRAHHALQCGFCTPGFLMLAEGFLAERPDPDEAEIREVVAANLCRCTGYQPLVAAIAQCAAARRAARENRSAQRKEL